MGWYVVQVESGKEKRTLEMIEKLDAGHLAKEIFIPQCTTKRKVDGSWVDHVEKLFPGYVFVVTRKVDDLHQQLKKVPAFTRLLGNDECFVRLSDDEVSLVEMLTSKKNRTAGMSTGVIEGDQIVVQRGPLKGHEGLISKVDRHKRIAYVAFPMFGRDVTVRIGLEVVSKG